MLSVYFAALALAAEAVRAGDDISICGVYGKKLRAAPCDDRDDGWTRLAKEYVRWYDCGQNDCGGEPDLPEVLEFLEDHCYKGSINTEEKTEKLDELRSQLTACNQANGCGAACPCNVDEPCRCSDIKGIFDAECPYASFPLPTREEVELSSPALNEVAGKRVLIIGAGRGFGRMTAIAFANEGAIVYGTSRNPQAYVDRGIDLSYMATGLIELELNDPASIAGLVGRLDAAGINDSAPIDVLILNGGMGITNVGFDVNEEILEYTYRVHSIGHIGVFRRMWDAELIARTPNSRVFGTGSLAGETGTPLFTTYSMAKRAWHHFVAQFNANMRAFGDTNVPQFVTMQPNLHCTTFNVDPHPLGANYTDLNAPNSPNLIGPDCSILDPGVNISVPSPPFTLPSVVACAGLVPFNRWLNTGYCCNDPTPIYGIPDFNPFGAVPGEYLPPPCADPTIIADGYVSLTLLPNPKDRYFATPVTAVSSDAEATVRLWYQSSWNELMRQSANPIVPILPLFAGCASPCATQNLPTLPEISDGVVPMAKRDIGVSDTANMHVSEAYVGMLVSKLKSGDLPQEYADFFRAVLGVRR